MKKPPEGGFFSFRRDQPASGSIAELKVGLGRITAPALAGTDT